MAQAGVDGERPATEGAQRQLGGVSTWFGARCRSQPGGHLGELVAGHAPKPFPQLIGGNEAEVADLVERGDAGVAPGALGHQQGPHSL